MSRARLLAAGTVFLCCIGVAALADQQMYKWVDSQGHVHYSQTPPLGTVSKPETVQIQTPQHYDTGVKAPAQSTGATIPRDSEVAAEARAQARKEQEQERKKALREQQCSSLNNQLAQYQSSGRMFTVDASGQRQYISDADHDKAIQDLKAQIAQQCSGPS